MKESFTEKLVRSLRKGTERELRTVGREQGTISLMLLRDLKPNFCTIKSFSILIDDE